DSGELAAAVAEQIGRQIVNLPRQDIARRSLRENGAVCVCTDIEEALGLANELAPEHLELLCANAWERSQSVRNAGSVFVGPWTPEPVGDYYAGLNHVLPTAGTARFFSPLSVDSFLKRMSVVEYTQSALTAAADDIMTLAEAEGLNAHAGAVKARIEKHG
ncbi:MAG: histidinol dehydrogenase, partial [Oscillospiraceae bacterium]|nr:histidinol dehydrogenase [Oscillospiraceae bacterium]